MGTKNGAKVAILVLATIISTAGVDVKWRALEQDGFFWEMRWD
jgi:hypothetical protein